MKTINQGKFYKLYLQYLSNANILLEETKPISSDFSFSSCSSCPPLRAP